MRLVYRIGAAALLVGLGFLLARIQSRDVVDESRWPDRIHQAFSSADRLDAARRLMPILESLDEDNLDVLAGAMSSALRRGGGDETSITLLMEGWAQIDALHAFDRVSEWSEDAQRQAVPALVRAWARRLPDHALEALEEFDREPLRSEALAAAVEGWVSANDHALWTYLASIERDREREGLMLGGLKALLKLHGPEGLVSYVESMPSTSPPMDSFRPKVFRATASLLARVDGPMAAEFAERHMGTPAGERMMRRVAVHWITMDPPAALAWVRKQKSGDERDRVLRESYRRWVIRDRDAATGWMRSQPDHSDLTSIYDMFGSAVARDDPKDAIAWIDAEIEDDALRKEALLDVAEVWLHGVDAKAAAAWVEERGLSEEITERTQQQRRR